MGRGDKKTKKGKISKGSFGKSRSRKAIQARIKRATTGGTPVAEGAAKPGRTK